MSDAPVSIKTGSIPGQTMHTREKIGSLCKRLLCPIVENKQKGQSVKEVVEAIGGDTKKVVDLIFTLESLGLITRITKNKFVYTGFRGMLQRFREFGQHKVKKSKSYEQNFRLMLEDMNIGGKVMSVKSSAYFGKFVSTIVWTVLLEANKSITRGEIESLFEEYSQYFKETSQPAKTIINDVTNLLITINFFEKNEANETLTWSGPDCINSVGLRNDNIFDIEDLGDVLKPQSSINYDQKEYNYFKNLLKDEIASNKIVLKSESFNKNQPTESFVKDPNSSLNMYAFTSFEQGGYALLKGKTWQYLMTKPCAIIGRSPSAKENTVNKKFKWEVDVDLVNCPSVSRQHAVILFNYEEETFEIKCLSKKNPVKVGGFIYDFKDKACPLESKTLITLGGESFYFYLPNIPSEKPEDEKKVDEEEKEPKEEGSVREDEEEKEEKEGKEEEEEEKMQEKGEGDEEEVAKEREGMEEDENKDEDEDEEEEEDDGEDDAEGMETE